MPVQNIQLNSVGISNPRKNRTTVPYSPKRIRGLQAWYSAKRSPITRAAGMAALFSAVTSESLSLDSAILRADGSTAWCRWFWLYVGDEVQRITETGSPTGGTFTITYGAETTSALTFDVSAADMQTALRLLTGLSGVTVTRTGAVTNFVWDITMTGAGFNPNAMTTTNSLLGGVAPATAVTTPATASGVLFSTLSANTGIQLEVTTGAVLKLSVGNGATVKTATHGTTLTQATWYLGYIECDATNIGVSLNAGALTQTAIVAPFSSGTQVAYYGADTTPGNFFNGRQQCVGGINDSVLSAAQLTALYNSGVPRASDQLPLAINSSTGFQFEFNEPSGTRATSIGAALTLTDNNTVTTATGTCLNAISQWNDISGNNVHVTQATQANRPYWRPSGLNGFPAVRTTSAETATAFLLAHTTLPIVARPFSIIAVIKSDSGTNTNSEFVFGGIVMFIFGNNWRIATVGTPLSGNAADANPHIFEGDFVVGTTSEIFVDNASQAVGDTGAGTLAGIYIGASSTPNNAWAGLIAEVLVINHIPTARERRQLNHYLSREYGIAAAA